ncbi:hypothetical protein HDU78_006941 [Chytriomyces hyalinus]|nr:hypothetical protein BJ741DRAFT_658835 [Chytriomyces cf. hyalinus JEL632]KAJ3232669.1 hypothetical protein HDU78_006941 [Chytriomyces hyalinus]KAJ3258522.1 hypothetical protein HDU77_002247 [Chytriomyces hyalinus]KAJ3388098.1 hypothetical protein HDU80_011776 [Chytriomyces hyalinus]
METALETTLTDILGEQHSVTGVVVSDSEGLCLAVSGNAKSSMSGTVLAIATRANLINRILSRASSSNALSLETDSGRDADVVVAVRSSDSTTLIRSEGGTTVAVTSKTHQLA